MTSPWWRSPSDSVPSAAVEHVNLSVGAGRVLLAARALGLGQDHLPAHDRGLRAALRRADPAAGSRRVGSPPYDRDVNTVFQDYALFPHLSVGENVEYGLKVKRVGRAERRLGRRATPSTWCASASSASRRITQLSGGQRQRVALARALVNRPKVLLLDEPLGALDLKLREEMQVELKRIQAEVGITFIYVTHDQDEALAMSDRLAVFSAGRIEQVGTPGEVYERPASAFVAGFVGTSNVIEGDLAVRLRGTPEPFTRAAREDRAGAARRRRPAPAHGEIRATGRGAGRALPRRPHPLHGRAARRGRAGGGRAEPRLSSAPIRPRRPAPSSAWPGTAASTRCSRRRRPRHRRDADRADAAPPDLAPTYRPGSDRAAGTQPARLDPRREGTHERPSRTGPIHAARYAPRRRARHGRLLAVGCGSSGNSSTASSGGAAQAARRGPGADVGRQGRGRARTSSPGPATPRTARTTRRSTGSGRSSSRPAARST